MIKNTYKQSNVFNIKHTFFSSESHQFRILFKRISVDTFSTIPLRTKMPLKAKKYHTKSF